MGKTPLRPAEKRRPPPACQGASGQSANFLGSAAGFFGAQNRLSTVSPSALSTDCGFFFPRPAWVLDAPDKICPPAFPPPRWRTFIVFWAFKIPNIIITYWKAFAQYAIFAGRRGGNDEGYSPSNTSPKGPLGPSGHPFGRTSLSALSSNFRQFSLWLAAKSRLGPKKNPTAVWYEQARPAICRIFRDCYAILGLLRRPTPDSRVLFTKLTCNPCDRNDGFSRQWCFSTIAA